MARSISLDELVSEATAVWFDWCLYLNTETGQLMTYDGFGRLTSRETPAVGGIESFGVNPFGAVFRDSEAGT